MADRTRQPTWSVDPPVRPVALRRADCRLTDRAWSVGTSPKTTPTITHTPSVIAKHPHVEARLLDARDAGRRDGDERLHAGQREPDARRGAGQREDHAFHQELTADAAQGSAERRLDGDLAQPPDTAREEQVRDVGARHQQHERDGAEQHEQRRPDRSEHHVGQELDVHAAIGVLGVRALELGCHHAQFLLGGGCRRVRREASDHEERVRRTGQLPWIGAERQPDIDTRIPPIREAASVDACGEHLREAEVGAVRNDADDRGRTIVDPEHRTHDSGIAVEQPRPEALADDDRLGGASRSILVLGEDSTDDRSGVEQRQRLRRGAEGGEPGRLCPWQSDADIHGDEAGEPFEGAAALLKIEVVGHRARLADRPAVAIGLPEDHQPIERIDRRRPQEDAVHDTEDRSVGADPEGQRHDDDCRGLRRSPEHRDAPAHVVREGIEHGEPALVAADLSHQLDPSELAPGRGLGRLRGQPEASVPLRALVEMRPDFSLQLGVTPAPREPIDDPAQEPGHRHHDGSSSSRSIRATIRAQLRASAASCFRPVRVIE